MQDIPAPPVPPELPPLPDFPVIVGGGEPEALIMLAVIATIVGGVLLWPLVRAWARRLERGPADPGLQEELEQMRAKVAEVDVLHQRVAELEERVDFSERILTRRGSDALPRGEA